MEKRKRISIKEVAREAGVSTATVSRVINDHPDVSQQTRQVVGEVIARLGYQPSNLARSLIQGRSRTVGVVGSGLKYFGPASIISAIEERASVLGYSLLLSLLRQPESNAVGQVFTDMLSRHVDGIVWAVPEIGNNHDFIQDILPNLPVPVVFLSMEPRPELSVIEFDNRAGGRLATQHLVDQGYQTIGVISGPLNWWAARQRLLGWQEVLEECGRPVNKNLIVEGDWLPASGELGLYRLLEKHPEIDAIFAGNDQMALGALKAAHFMGRQVPAYLAVVGFDDVPEAAFYHPPLSTIRQDMVSMGYSAMKELGRLMDSWQGGMNGNRAESCWLQPQLVARESSGGSPAAME